MRCVFIFIFILFAIVLFVALSAIANTDKFVTPVCMHVFGSGVIVCVKPMLITLYDVDRE